MSGAAAFFVDGKTAIITGAGSGINYCFAKLLLSRGCNVLIADLALRPEAQKLVDEYTSKPRAVFQKTDVTSWPDLNAMFSACIKEFGSVDLVCPGAGVFEPPWSSFWYPPGSPESKDDPAGSRYLSMDINLTHPLRVAQLAISHFLNPPPNSSNAQKASPTNPKRIIFISSIAGESAGMGAVLYTAAKHAVSALIYSLAGLETLGIRCSGVGPGLIKTPLFTDHPEKSRIMEESDEWVTPDYVAEVMLKLAEDETMPGGTILRVGKERFERVPLFNNPGPQYVAGSGYTASNGKVLAEEAFAQLGREAWGVVPGKN